MARCKANGIELEYETFGSPTAPPILLVTGHDLPEELWDHYQDAIVANIQRAARR